MKLWVIPWPWDYHQMAAIVVMASTREAALRKARKWYGAEQRREYGVAPTWDEIRETEAPGIYEDSGCDC